MEIINYSEGMEIVAPMIIRGMPNEVYHGQEGISSSYLKEVSNGSIYSANKKRLDMAKKKHFKRGGIFHDLTEGFTAGYGVMGRYFIYPEYNKTSKQSIIDAMKPVLSQHGSKSIDELAEIEIRFKGQKRDVLKVTAEALLEKYADGKTKITDEDLGQAESMLNALKEHPDSAQWMSLEGESELSFYHIEEVEVDGEIIKILLKVRCDRFIETDDTIFILDWKSTADIPTPANVIKAQRKFGYDFSASMYRYIVSKFTDKPIHFLNIFVSSEDPCKENVAVVMFSEEDLNSAFDNFQEGLQKYALWELYRGWTGVERDAGKGFIMAPMRKFYESV